MFVYKPGTALVDYAVQIAVVVLPELVDRWPELVDHYSDRESAAADAEGLVPDGE